MIFTTPVELPAGTMEISHRSRLLLIGSCFAGNIGAALLDRKFNVDVNPFGVQYNPMSIATVLARIADGDLFKYEILDADGKVVCEKESASDKENFVIEKATLWHGRKNPQSVWNTFRF